MTGMAALKASIIILVGLVAVVYGLAGQTELSAGLEGKGFCRVTWPDGDTWIWTRLGDPDSLLPYTVTGDDHARCQVHADLDNGGYYYIAHRGDATPDDIRRLDRSCGPEDAPCAEVGLQDVQDGTIITSITRQKATVRPVWADLPILDLNPLYDFLGRPFLGLVSIVAVFSFGALAWRAWDS